MVFRRYAVVSHSYARLFVQRSSIYVFLLKVPFNSPLTLEIRIWTTPHYNPVNFSLRIKFSFQFFFWNHKTVQPTLNSRFVRLWKVHAWKAIRPVIGFLRRVSSGRRLSRWKKNVDTVLRDALSRTRPQRFKRANSRGKPIARVATAFSGQRDRWSGHVAYHIVPDFPPFAFHILTRARLRARGSTLAKQHSPLLEQTRSDEEAKVANSRDAEKHRHLQRAWRARSGYYWYSDAISSQKSGNKNGAKKTAFCEMYRHFSAKTRQSIIKRCSMFF